MAESAAFPIRTLSTALAVTREAPEHQRVRRAETTTCS